MSSTLIDFLLRERVLTVTVLASIITFQFITVFKINITDPLLELAFPDTYFDFLKIKIRDGVEMPKPPPRQIVIDFGALLKALIGWLIMIYLIYLLYKYSRLQESPGGNHQGAAIM
jgi:large-conductance mechanosensitive channel